MVRAGGSVGARRQFRPPIQTLLFDETRRYLRPCVSVFFFPLRAQVLSALCYRLRLDRGNAGFAARPSHTSPASRAPSAYSVGSDGKRQTGAAPPLENPPPRHPRTS